MCLAGHCYAFIPQLAPGSTHSNLKEPAPMYIYAYLSSCQSVDPSIIQIFCNSLSSLSHQQGSSWTLLDLKFYLLQPALSQSDSLQIVFTSLVLQGFKCFRFMAYSVYIQSDIMKSDIMEVLLGYLGTWRWNPSLLLNSETEFSLTSAEANWYIEKGTAIFGSFITIKIH